VTERLNLDYNAGAPLDPRVAQAMAELPPEADANPSSAHALGRAARALLEDARERIAAALTAEGGAAVDARELLFCSGGTEANQLALRGSFAALALDREGELWLSPIEHASVLGPSEALGEQAQRVRRLSCSAAGQLLWPGEPERGPVFASICAACGETGVLQPVEDFARRLQGQQGLLHCDASQAVGRLALRGLLAADYLTISPHKFGGPRGIGLLLRRHGRPLRPLWQGGGQEQGLRPGTEAVRLAQGTALALELALQEREERARRMRAALELLLEALVVAGARICFREAALRLPNTATAVFPGLDARLLLPAFDAAGLCCSFGTACSSGARELSKPLLALGLREEEARSALRFSVGPEKSCAPIERASAVIPQVLARIRAITP
jgi:cysteine desulfurase